MSDLRYVELAGRLRSRIEEGTFRVGERLPSVRRLARESHISVSTACRALEELERWGLVEARPRSGHFVRPRQDDGLRPRPAARADGPRRAKPHALTESIVETTGRVDLVPLGGAALSTQLVPTARIARITRELLRKRPEILVSYGPSPGLAPLRRVLARRFAAAAADVTPDDIVVAEGCMGAIQIALRSVAGAGDTIAVESPSFFGFHQLLRDTGAKVVEIPTDAETGLNLDALFRTHRDNPIRAVIVTPNFQNPLGSLMPAGQRAALVRWSRRHRVVLIESDVYGDLYYGGHRPSSLLAEDPSGYIISCSSFSKTLAPGLRVGFAVSPRYAAAMRPLKLSGSICSPGLNQWIIHELIAHGGLDRHLRALRPKLEQQVQAIRALVQRTFPAPTRISQPAGGFLLWVELPRRTSARALYAQALNVGISILPGTVCALSRRFDHCMRLNCGHPVDERTHQAIATLASFL